MQQIQNTLYVTTPEAYLRLEGETVCVLLLVSGRLPPPMDDARLCPECSLCDICQPELARAGGKLVALRADLFESKNDVP